MASLIRPLNGTGYTVLVPPSDWRDTQATAVDLQSDGKIVTAGVATGIDGASDMFVARYNANGTLDTTFGAGTGHTRFDMDGMASVTHEHGHDLAIQPDGKIVIAGVEFSQLDLSRQNILVVRLNADGSSDRDFGLGGYKLGTAPVGHSFGQSAVVLQPDRDIILAGSIADGEGTNPVLMRFYGPGNPTASTSSPEAANDDALMLVLTEASTTTTKRK
jgi:uncharacterized delta-60 repeat protein